MSYAELYKYCQTLHVPVSRKYITPKIVELLARPNKPFVLVRGFDPTILRGAFLLPGPAGLSKLARWSKGEPVILIARDMEPIWHRFVMIKELMHYFDEPLEHVSTPVEFESLLQEFNAPKLKRSLGMTSEVKALWMALGVVCPELLRQELNQKREAGAMSDAQISCLLKIPEYYVRLLFVPDFKQRMTELCGC
jgi:hypothetical protein